MNFTIFLPSYPKKSIYSILGGAMNKKQQELGIAKMLGGAATIGIVNALFVAFIINPYSGSLKPDEGVLNTFGQADLVFLALFNAWLLLESYGEWKQTKEAVQKRNKRAFLLEAPKRIAPTYWALDFVISALAVMTFWLYHYSSPVTLGYANFGIAFLVALAITVLKDIDDPITGVINVEGIPPKWLDELEKEE